MSAKQLGKKARITALLVFWLKTLLGKGFSLGVALRCTFASFTPSRIKLQVLQNQENLDQEAEHQGQVLH